MEVRVAQAGDEDRCLELIEALTDHPQTPQWRTTFRELLTGTRGEILVAEEDEEIFGVATVSYNLAMRYGGEYAQLEELIVDPSARGKNVGGILMANTVERARARGCAELGLYLLERTEHNRPFYEKYGFEWIGSEMRRRLRSDG